MVPVFIYPDNYDKIVGLFYDKARAVKIAFKGGNGYLCNLNFHSATADIFINKVLS